MFSLCSYVGQTVIIWSLGSHLAIIGRVDHISSTEEIFLSDAVMSDHVIDEDNYVDILAEAGPDTGEQFMCLGEHSIRVTEISQMRPIETDNIVLFKNFCGPKGPVR